MKYLFKNTKIVSTFGPAITREFNTEQDLSNPEFSSSLAVVEKTIEDLILAGINCVRFNFSHGSSEEQLLRVKLINRVQKKFIESQNSNSNKGKFLRPMILMADTKGPEIRVYTMEAKEGVTYEIGDILTISCIERIIGNKSGFSVLDSTGRYNMANDCVVGNTILVEDGKLSLEILEVDKVKGLVKAKVRNRHILKANKRINLPGADYSMDFLSEKDVFDICLAMDNGFEYVALSFVNSKENILEVRNLIEKHSKEKGIKNKIKIISKIETLKSCENIDDIIEYSDGVMIARGDLGLEIPYFQVPYWTKKIVRKCWEKGKPVIVATQMLDSLERSVVATRAEVSDVYRAAELGTDCTMLSGETAQGLFPVIAVKTMCDIVYESEKFFNYDRHMGLVRTRGMSSEVEKICGSLLEVVKNNKDVGAILVSSKDVDPAILEAISFMRLSVPLFNFISVENLDMTCGAPHLSCPVYCGVKDHLSLSLHRSINPVLVSGSTSDLISTFREFRSIFDVDSCFNGKVVYFDNGSWKI
ncbi:pyruvate kinase [Mycoplasma haemocanis str. Illinois]|uniref:Pyruvate kinase n=1 Tax=Mycoplasma haemocanis (strain Illinois) TaxID=1111676 RepID=H6N8H6_MYCHN|nr:pyruvate kinase [Mycoplasma haemocanis]AEW45948.1 pyruvate kinase [Mycoplasma haemocanis str. Illinois]